MKRLLIALALFMQAGGQPTPVALSDFHMTGGSRIENTPSGVPAILAGSGSSFYADLGVTPAQLQTGPNGKSWNGMYQFNFSVLNYFPHYPGYLHIEVDFGTQELCDGDIWVIEQQQQISKMCPGPAYLVIDSHQPGGGPAQGQNDLVISFTASEGWPVYTNNVSWSFTAVN